MKEVCRQHGISTATYYQWKSRFGGLDASDVKRMRELRHENQPLKQMYPELWLENTALKDLIHRKL